MTTEEFWFSFQANEYAVRCDTQEQHDRFIWGYENFFRERINHKYNLVFPYLYYAAGPKIIGGWTGEGNYPYGKQKITFRDWLSMQEQEEEDIAVGNLSEVL